MAARPLISLCMIVRDEASCLARCLCSVRGIVDEMVVVDTGSTDETVQIAEAHGARVEHLRWDDDFAAARNRSLELARGRWALVLDADEELRPGSARWLRRAARSRAHAGYTIPLRNLLDGERSTVLLACRMFRLDQAVRYEYAIHEQVLPSLVRYARRRRLALPSLAGVEILHHGYRGAVVTKKGKEARNDRLFRRQIERTPEDAYVWWKFGEHFCKHGRFDEALPALERALALVRELPRARQMLLPFAAPLCAMLAVVCEQRGDRARGLEVCRFALSSLRPHPDVLTTAGRLLLLAGEPDEAEALHRRALRMDAMACEAGGWPGATTVRPAAGLGDVARARGDLGAARRWYRAALDEDPGFAEAALGLVELEAQEGRVAEALAVLELALQRQPRSFRCWKRGAALWLAQENRPRALVWYGAAHRLDPGDPEVRWELGLLALGGGDAEMALGLFEGAMETEARCALAVAMLALALGERLLVDVDLEPAAADAALDALLCELARGGHRSLLEGLQERASVVAEWFPQLEDLVKAARLRAQSAGCILLRQAG